MTAEQQCHTHITLDDFICLANTKSRETVAAALHCCKATKTIFHDFPGLENGLPKFHDFP